ncbi:interleukin-13 receptor subunit alpha-1 isoform X1 [Anolis carolinensis]|uniref:interleukin-13 receptor subunit alpha-1 isoform X1 n=1 Tax=Anolis carolinensis TaxID=28377 RepID=UPI002F2B4DFB
MASPSLPPPPHPLLVFLFTLQALVAPGGEGATVLPRLSDVHYEIREELCQLTASWAPVPPSSDSCVITYESDIDVDGEGFIGPWDRTPSRTVLVPLGNQNRLIFKARATCNNNNTFAGEWFELPIRQNGTAGTGARNISCIWRYKESIQCSWRRGENASPHTLYNLSYWWSPELRSCTNYTKEGDVFRCTFHFDAVLVESFAISIRGNSDEVQTVCLVTKYSIEEKIPIKLHTPKIVDIKESSDGVYLTWTQPKLFTGICYQVEVNNTKTKIRVFEDHTNVSIPLALKGYHTFRVRSAADSSGSQCQETRGNWSDWSEPVDWGKPENMNYLLLLLIPLCVAILTVILLLYLKKIKLLILPTIPDPGKFLKNMFEEQSEDLPSKGMFQELNQDLYKQPLQLRVKEEPTDLLIVTSGSED